MKLFCLLLSMLLFCFSWLQKNTITWCNVPQAADACAGYPVTHYNLSFARSSDVNQSILMLGPSSTNGASRIEATLNSTDGILQNVQYRFQISAVNIVGSSTSSSLVPGTREKRRSAWYTLFAHAFNLPKMWGLRAIFWFFRVMWRQSSDSM